MFRRYLPIALLAALAGTPAVSPAADAVSKPNVMLVIADDMCWRDCQPYGNREIPTPNMTRLAAEGMRMDAMFTATAMCAPTRQQLYTGVFPVRNGAYPNHSRVYDGTRSVVHHLGKLGYRVGLIGKTHFKPRESFPFEILPGGKGGASNTKAIAEFVDRDKSQPYCLMVCSNEPHTPWSKGDPSRFDAAKLTVPPYLVDNEQTRAGLVKYYAEITFLDGQLGGCMKVVDDSADPQNTIVIFTSEQGSSFPFGAKWTCYDTGLKTSFLVRWPARIKPGSTSDAMVQYVDVVPTLVEAAGGNPAKIDTGRPGGPDGGRGFDGRSFLGVLLGETDSHHDHVYGAHTTRGIINGSECYPIRSVRSRTHKYIRNLNHEVRFENALTGNRPGGILASWAAMGGAAAERAKAYQVRPAEELYDLAKDPYELNNLAGDPELADVKAALSGKLDAWMTQQGDEGNVTELKAKERQGSGRPSAKPKPGTRPRRDGKRAGNKQAPKEKK